MKRWQGFLIYLAGFLIQPFLYNLAPGLKIVPNLILCFTVVLTLLYDDMNGLFFGTVFGLLIDICYGLYVGPGAFAIALIGIGTLILKEFINVENIIVLIIVSIISTWAYLSIYWLIYFIVGSPYGYGSAMAVFPWQGLFNLVVMVIMYMIFIKKVIKHRRDRYFR